MPTTTPARPRTSRPRVRALLRQHAERILDLVEERHPIVLFDREDHAAAILALMREPIDLAVACFGVTERTVAESISDSTLAVYADAWAAFLLDAGVELDMDGQPVG